MCRCRYSNSECWKSCRECRKNDVGLDLTYGKWGGAGTQTRDAHACGSRGNVTSYTFWKLLGHLQLGKQNIIQM
jgi:hypothetical protein